MSSASAPGQEKQVAGGSILRVEFMGVTERLVRLKIVAELRENGSVESIQLEEIGPLRKGIRQGCSASSNWFS